MDFFKYLQDNLVLNVMTRLDDPADLVRASIVSRLWGNFVVSRELCKKLSASKFPLLANVVDAGSSCSPKEEQLSRWHKIYAALLYTLQKLKSLTPTNCIEEAFGSSSKNHISENVACTIELQVIFGGRRHWSSKGQKDPDIPETLIYKLKSELSLVTEISIMPYGDKWWYTPKEPTYSAKFVRFRMGYPKAAKNEFEANYYKIPDPADDHFTWEYTSPLFEMAQEDKVQTFKFPEPVLCIGGYVMVELLGRVQQKEGLYYIKIAEVKVLGRSLNPAFDVESVGSSGKFVLKYDAAKLQQTVQGTAKEKKAVSKRLRHEMTLFPNPPPHLRGMGFGF